VGRWKEKTTGERRKKRRSLEVEEEEVDDSSISFFSHDTTSRGTVAFGSLVPLASHHLGYIKTLLCHQP